MFYLLIKVIRKYVVQIQLMKLITKKIYLDVDNVMQIFLPTNKGNQNVLKIRSTDSIDEKLQIDK